MRRLPALLLLATAALAVRADEPKLTPKPDAFQTLVNPNCSHCVDEAKRRAGELHEDDPVLCWTRGYSDGGAIPIRFFLSKHRVISDSYGVFVYDPDAGFARGFAPSYNFVFHGWRNGVMVIKDMKDGTLYSALTGLAFEGPKKGQRLKTVPTVVSKWGWWLKHYPHAVAYHMFEKYKPVPLPKEANADSVKTRPTKVDPRLKPEEEVLGVWSGKTAVAYPLSELRKYGFIDGTIDGEKVIVVYEPATNTAAAYRLVATQPRKFKGPNPNKDGVSPADEGVPVPVGTPVKKSRTIEPVVIIRPDEKPIKKWPDLSDKHTGSHFDITGRGTSGELKGWTLEPVDCVVCKWFAWAAEYPDTAVYGEKKPAPKPNPEDALADAAGSAEILKLLPKPFATLKAFDAKARTVTLLLDGEKIAKVWPLEPDAEVKVAGFWGRLEQFKPNQRVWVWLKLDRKKNPTSVVMFADERSEEYIHNKVTLKPGEAKGGKQEKQGDAELLQGMWTIVAQTVDGEAVQGKDLEKGELKVSITEKQLTFIDNGHVRSRNSWRIDATTTPKQIDLTVTEPVIVEGERTLAIYRLDADTLTLCLPPRGGKRPTNFESKRGDDRIIHVLKRTFADPKYGEQVVWMRTQWVYYGLPGTVAVAHLFSGEVEVLIDHEGMRWARSLARGDIVHITADPPIKAVVKAVSPWRERTQLRLVASDLAASELKPGQRVHVKMADPGPVEFAEYPPDIGRERTKAERVEWFLANMYCVCSVKKDTCTGHFYTLASCNPYGCGAPNATRKQIARLIDEGKSDKEIWDALRKDRGPLMLRPHLLP